MKFRRIPTQNSIGHYRHPEGTAGIGIHALNSDTWMTIEEIMEVHRNYYKNTIGAPSYEEGIPPTWGELIRDLGIFVCFHMAEVKECEND